MKQKTNISVKNNLGMRVPVMMEVGADSEYPSGNILDANATISLIDQKIKSAADSQADDTAALKDIEDKIPAKTSQLINDSDFINYLTASETFALKTEVQSLKNELNTLLDQMITNGHEYVEIGGIKWATVNIGASSYLESGDYFLWGCSDAFAGEDVPYLKEDAFFSDNYKFYKNGNAIKYNPGDNLTVLEPADDTARLLWGGQWRMPTLHDFLILRENTNVLRSNLPNDSFKYLFAFIDKVDPSKRIYFVSTGNIEAGYFHDSPSVELWTSEDDASRWGNGFYAPGYAMCIMDLELGQSEGMPRNTAFPIRPVIG